MSFQTCRTSFFCGAQKKTYIHIYIYIYIYISRLGCICIYIYYYFIFICVCVLLCFICVCVLLVAWTVSYFKYLPQSVRNDMRVSKWWQNVFLWLNYSLNNRECVILSRELSRINKDQSWHEWEMMEMLNHFLACSCLNWVIGYWHDYSIITCTIMTTKD